MVDIKSLMNGTDQGLVDLPADFSETPGQEIQQLANPLIPFLVCNKGPNSTTQNA